ncbi:MAG: NADH-quinone oxidoreductase subunit NuoE [Rhodospirillaceae bacterium]|nr:MAG: NADH-quinone oxidoreductase subunit NuoE [Rhodospirillaceae bacterium]
MSENTETFAFSAESLDAAKAIFAKYPEGRGASAVMPLLTLAQRQNDNWLPRAAMDVVADMCDMAPIRVYEVATFYTMYNLKPVGKNFVQVCTNISCLIKGSDDVFKACKKKMGIENGETTEDGLFTLLEVECLGACVNAPMMQINDDFYEDLDADTTTKVLDALANGETPAAGSQAGKRVGCQPDGGLTTLKGA